MTRSQVRYLLGTPMLADPFDPQRWDYIYTFTRGRDSKIDRAHFVVHFDGDKVSKVEKLDLPDGTNDPKKKKNQASAEPTREPPPLPSISQPQPDAPRPAPAKQRLITATRARRLSRGVDAAARSRRRIARGSCRSGR